jgi:hypothetical protein
MLRHTSDKGFVDTISASPVRGLLYDFDIEGDTLKEHHTQWLDTMVVDQVKKNKDKRWKVFLEGETSRTGSDKFNEPLSQRRAEAVRRYLRDKFAGLPVDFDTKWVGRKKAVAAGKKHADEDRVDRAVQVALDESTAPVPPPLPPLFQPGPPIPPLVPPLGRNEPFQRNFPGLSLPPGFFSQQPGETPDERNRRIAQQIFRTIPPPPKGTTPASVIDRIAEKLTKDLDPIIKKLPGPVQDVIRDAIATGVEKGTQAILDQALSETKLSDNEKNAVRNTFQGILKFKTP